jgi:LPXTG-motif cell wall-anchored protein
MVQVKISQLILAAAVAAASLAGFGAVADAAPACPEGLLNVVTDDSGVQHQACVAVGIPPAPAAKAAFAPQVENAPTPSRATLPATGTGNDGLVIAALLVASGSAASLISRRRRRLPNQKWFRRQDATP